MNAIGIMQGRLSPMRNGRIQSFPFDHWEKEFEIAARIQLNEIEFIFDDERFTENPLWTETGLTKIKQCIDTTGVKVNFICADYFMALPFFRCTDQQRQERIEICRRLLTHAHLLGVRGIEIPLVDNSSIKTPEDMKQFQTVITQLLPTAEKFKIAIGLETDLAPEPFLTLLRSFDHPLIKANYDTGNSSGLGYDTTEEITTYGKYINNVHIKDRLLHGGTVPLGTGNADLPRSIQEFKRINYSGSYILQAARGKDDIAEAQKNRAFVMNLLQ